MRGPRPTLAALHRARAALEEAGLDPETPLEPVPSSNEVWFAGDHVVRIAAGSGHALEREAGVLRALPPSVPHVRVVAAGRSATRSWMVTERVPGTTLAWAWPLLRPPARRAAVAELGAALAALHATPADLVPAPAFADLECPHQLPASRLLDLLERAGRLPSVPTALVRSARAFVEANGDVLDPPGAAEGLVHGDLHLENVLWHGGHVVALLDLEWARPGPPDLDLDVLLRFCADPSPHVEPLLAAALGHDDLAQVPTWLAEDQPQLFAHPRLADRLALYALGYDLRCLLLDPPTSPPEALPPHHALHRVRRLVRPW